MPCDKQCKATCSQQERQEQEPASYLAQSAGEVEPSKRLGRAATGAMLPCGHQNGHAAKYAELERQRRRPRIPARGREVVDVGQHRQVRPLRVAVCRGVSGAAELQCPVQGQLSCQPTIRLLHLTRMIPNSLWGG